MHLEWPGKSEELERVARLNASPERIVTGEVWPEGTSLFEDPLSRTAILGDSGRVLASLRAEGFTAPLIYIDPPFSSGQDREAVARLRPRSKGPGLPGASYSHEVYADTWDPASGEFAGFLYRTLLQLKDLLTDDGSIYLHLDWRAAHHARCIMDEVFGPACFQNEIAWCYREAINSKKRWNRKHDTILFYTKHPSRFTFNAESVLQPHSAATSAKYRNEDENGRYRLMGRGIQGSPICSARDVDPAWEESNPELVFRHYQRAGTLPVDYFQIDGVNQAALERTGYPTQKPIALLERIIAASSNPGDLVLDCFSGSGTTAAAAEKLGRGWIVSDSAPLARHTLRKRMLGLPRPPRFALGHLDGEAPPAGTAHVACARDGGEWVFRLEGIDVPEGDRSAPWKDWTDCWAVDTAYDGAIFMPCWHALRPRRGKLPLEARIPAAAGSGGQALVRVTDAAGRDYEANVSLDALA